VKFDFLSVVKLQISHEKAAAEDEDGSEDADVDGTGGG
jgi:hypothetical protein